MPRSDLMDEFELMVDRDWGEGVRKAGQIHYCLPPLDDFRLVRLVRLLNENMGYASDWRVEDVFTGECFFTKNRSLSHESLNEMEVLAWAAK